MTRVVVLFDLRFRADVPVDFDVALERRARRDDGATPQPRTVVAAETVVATVTCVVAPSCAAHASMAAESVLQRYGLSGGEAKSSSRAGMGMPPYSAQAASIDSVGVDGSVSKTGGCNNSDTVKPGSHRWA